MWQCEKSHGNVHVAPDRVGNGEESFLAYGALELCEKLNALERQRDSLASALQEIAEQLSVHPDAHIGNKIVHYAYEKARSVASGLGN